MRARVGMGEVTLLCRARRVLACVAFLGFTVGSACAATATYEVLLDSDLNAATGCTVATAGGPVPGIEQVLVTTVTTTSSGANVTSVARRVCSGGTLGVPIPVSGGGWAVGFGNGSQGTAVVETFIPRTALGSATRVRAALAANGGGGSDAIPGSGALPEITLEIPNPVGPAATAIPALAPAMLLGLAILLAGVAVRALRRPGPLSILFAAVVAATAAGLVWAASVIYDGQTGDWTGVAPLATDAKGDAPKNADLVAFFAQSDAVNLGFRIDADIEFDTSAPVNQAPTANAGTDQAITLPASANLAGSASDDGLPNPPATLTFTWSKVSGPGTVTFGNANAASTAATFSASGVYLLRLSASDGALTTTDDVQITVNPAVATNQAPTANAGADQTITLPASANLSGSASDDGLPNPPGAITIGWSKVSGPGTVTFGNATAAVTTASFSQDGVYVLRLTVNDGALSQTDDVQVTVNPAGGLPVLVAPPVDATVATNVYDASVFLYSGPNPVQTGMAAATIVPHRAAVVRGKVLDRAGNPLPGVTVAILQQPEYGQTQTRSDGMFDMVVNGGGPLTIVYAVGGHLTVHRQANVPWQKYVVLPDVMMTPIDAQVSTITGNAGVMQVHQGSSMSDGDGTRRAVLLFQAGTTAQMVLPNGSTQPLASFNVRATEYTVGPDGPRAMPAVLPPTSAYTYAVELSVDEAIAAGATRVDFSQPVSMHVDNFLGFPVGMAVPTGYYDRVKAAWVAVPNGRVIRITGVTNGLADVDTVGTGSLPPLTLGDAERQQLAILYPVGQTLWRVPVSHFTPWDCNWPRVLADDAVYADGSPRTEDDSETCIAPPLAPLADVVEGSIIECQKQVLRQSLPIVGTPFRLNYSSGRVPGRAGERTLSIPLSGASIPASLKRIELQLQIAGRTYLQSFPAAINQQTTFLWDGLDAYGRALQGRQSISGSIDYVYDAQYAEPGTFESAFARLGGGPIVGNRTRSEITLPKPFNLFIGSLDLRPLGLGGWLLSAQHLFDPTGPTLHYGHGSRRNGKSLGPIIDTVAGGGPFPAGTNLELATETALNPPDGVAVGPDGSVYFVEKSPTRKIRRIGTDGRLYTAAGSGLFTPFNDNVVAWDANIDPSGGLAIGPDGSIYLIDGGHRRVRRVTPNGIMTTVAGTGLATYNGDGIPAVQANLNLTTGGLALAPDGSLYIAEPGGHRVRRVGTDGIITTVAGTGVAGYNGDGIPATQATLNSPRGVAVAPDGSLYVSDSFNNRVRRIGLDGIITTVAGTGNSTFNGDGVPATQANLNGIASSVAFGLDGSYFFASQQRLRRVDPAGIISTEAGGTGVTTFNGDDIPAAQANLACPAGIAVGPDGRHYLAESCAGNLRIRVIRQQLAGFSSADVPIASEDGRVIYLFNGAGRHLRTIHALTGTTLHEFAYDPAGRLASVVERTGGTDNVTTIGHDANGKPTQLVGPFGQQTLLTTDGNGFLASLANPVGEMHQMAQTSDGLMTSFTAPGNRTRAYQFDAAGRLTRAEDPAGGFQDFVRSEVANGYDVARTTALGRTTHHRVENLSTGDEKLTTVASDGTQVVTEFGPDGTHVATYPDGSVATSALGPDSRFGMQAPFVQVGTSVMPSGLTLAQAATRVATLSDPADVLSLVSATDTSTVNGRSVTSNYTAATRTDVVTTAAGRSLTTVLDGFGRVVSTQAGGLTASSRTYDSRGRVSAVTLGARGAAFAYNPQGYLQSVTDLAGRAVQYTHDAVGRVTAKSVSGAGTVAFAYDGAGDLVSILSPGGSTFAFAYDARGNLTTVTPPTVSGTGPAVFAYDADNDLASVTRPGGEQVTFSYDGAGRLAGLGVASPNLPVATYGITYDAAGRISVVTGPGTQTATHGYDGPLVTSTSWGGPFASSVAWTYDSDLRIASETVAGTGAIAFGYDADSLLIAVGSASIARSAQTGAPTSLTLGSLVESYTYNALGELVGQTLTAAGAPVFAAAFVRDAAGRILQRQETIGGSTDTYDYNYDVVGQLVQVRRNAVVTESYVYDANGNRVSATLAGFTTASSHDAQDRLLSAGANTYVHSPAGKLQRKTSSAGNSDFRYDSLGNLIDVVLPTGTTIGYRHDGWDRRVQKLIDGALSRQYVHAGGSIAAELDASGNVISRFVYGGGVAPIYMIRGASTYRIVVDGNASVRLVVNAATGAIVQRIDYDAFGRVTLDSNPEFQPFGFAGGLYDPQTGLVRLGARDYDPEAGRWTNKDPLGIKGGDPNLYRYSRNDPVNRTDPTGLVTFEDVTDFAGGFLEESIPGPPQLSLLNPGIGLAVATDAVSRAVSGALGYPTPGQSLYDQLFSRPPAYDRDSAAFALGEFTADMVPICSIGVAAIRKGASMAAKGASKAWERASEAIDDLARQREIRRQGEEIARRAQEKAARAAAEAAAEAAAKRRGPIVERLWGFEGGGGGGRGYAK